MDASGGMGYSVPALPKGNNQRKDCSLEKCYRNIANGERADTAAETVWSPNREPYRNR